MESCSGLALPDMHPGALPRLVTLSLLFPCLRTPLPPSWGSSPNVLPALEDLELGVDLQGGLPAGWGSGGFRRLRRLALPTPHLGTPRSPLEPWQLPPAWAAVGAFPALQELSLTGVGVTGPLPDAWAGGGLPALQLL